MGEHDDTTAASSASSSLFEAIRHTTADGGEYWSARELARVLGYTEYGKFARAIARAIEACKNAGADPANHFARVSDMVAIGSGARRRIEDYHLSRYACYLTVQNADPDKPAVANGQTYFATQTRRQELADADALAGLTEAQRRVYARRELAEQNKELAAAAQGAGVVTPRDFAVFQDHGYRGLYAGENARDIAARKGLPKGAAILDWMGSEELAANLFRSTQAEAKLRRGGITDKGAANETHREIGAAVRRFIIEDLAGTPPEELPTPAHSIQQIEARERRRIEEAREREARPSLFPELDTRGEGEEGEGEE